MLKTLLSFFALGAIILLAPDQALAWGPGVHLAVGNSLLAQTHLLTPFLSELFTAHRQAFLYGCLSADIFIGKGTKFRPGHSHNWDTGFRLLESVHDPRLMAYAYGYISHLAADTVAHNLFVPAMLTVAPSGGTASHVYVEMLADQKVGWDRRQASRVLNRAEIAADDLLLAAMQRAKLPFLLKKNLMRSGLFLCRQVPWDISLDLASRLLPAGDFAQFLDDMVSLSLRAVVDVFERPLDSPALEMDPIGSRNLEQARRMRRSCGRRFASFEPEQTFPVPACLAGLPLLPPTPDVLPVLAVSTDRH
ncbi:MAG: zinc dependent phospholipase C family protein [Desulfovibrionaceae bacterium]